MRTPASLRIVAVCSLLAIGSPLRATDAQLANVRVTELIAQADKASVALNFDEAQARADEAIGLAEKTGDRLGLAMSQRMKGVVFIRLGRGADAVQWLERALAGFEALGNKRGIADSLASLTSSAITLGQNAKARELGARAVAIYQEIGEEQRRAIVLLNLNRIEPRGPRRDAILADVLGIAAKLGDDTLRAEALRGRASDMFDAGDFEGARKNFEDAIAVLEKTSDVESLAASHLSLGRVFRAHGDLDGALLRYQKAIDLLAPTKERFTLVQATNASAIAFGMLGRHKEAIAAYERGVAFARESGNPRMIDFMEGNLAGGLMAAGEYERAIPALEAAIAKRPELSLLGYRYYALARAFGYVGRAADALSPFSESIRIARETKDVDNLGVRLNNLSAALSKLGRFEEALADSREALEITEQIRTSLVPSDFLKRGYGERVETAYLQTVDLLSRLDRGSEALEVAEQARARAFLDLLAAGESGVEIATRGDARSAAARGADLASEAMGRPLNVTGIQQVATRLRSTIVTYSVTDDATLVWVIHQGGQVTHRRLPVGRSSLVKMVLATTAPFREPGKAAATRGEAATEPVAAPQAAVDDLTALPMRGLGLLALSRDDKSAWRELYQALIEPVRALLPARGGRLTIVPHGPLFQLSFAALQSRTGRYLIEDYELHYAPAISALEFTGRRQQVVAGNAKGPWAIVGNPTTLPVVGDRPLPPLPGAAREISTITALAPKGSALRLDGAGADEAALVRAIDASHPSLLHFATHGFVFDDPKKPPFLALNRTGTTAADDGKLTLDEVYGLRLTTDLVVLSACRSGSGQVSSDGILGLTRGFFYAGSPSVMATFWDVADEATAYLMSGFYRRYAQSHAKGWSLRAAQLALLADLRAGKVIVTAAGRRVTLPEHPLLWAAFFLSGEP